MSRSCRAGSETQPGQPARTPAFRYDGFAGLCRLELLLVSAPAEHPPGQRVRHRTVAQNQSTVDDHVEDAFAEVVRIFVRRHVPNLRGIEDHDIGLHAGTEYAAVAEVRAIGGLRRRFAHHLLEREEMLVANVMAEDARE